MCGIWAIISSSHIDREYVRKHLPLLESLENRGPDKTTFYTDDNVVFGHTRLSIHDVSVLGDQPFTLTYYDEYEQRNVCCTLIVNGEIYNFREIIKEHNLENLKSNSDCEVITKLWEKYKNINTILDIIRGEYAFILHIEYLQTETKPYHFTSYICRDPFGVRPLFWNMMNGRYFIGSTLYSVGTGGRVFTPGHYATITKDGIAKSEFYLYPKIEDAIERDIKIIFKNSTDKLIHAVKIRFSSDRPVGITLSGGLDSSLVAGIATMLGIKDLHTFTTGLPGSIDIEMAELCAKHIGSIHKSVPKSVDFACSRIRNAIRMLETWDVTTIRASIWQIIISEYISLNTDIKVILNGDGSDEILMGYKENYLAPSNEEAFNNVEYRLRNIHKFDGLRMDRSVASHGLEARPPFLDVDFVNYMRTIDPSLLRPIKGERMEKDIIRQAFKTLYPDIIPDEILLRPKEAFSDGVSTKDSSKSWFNIIQEYIECLVTDEEFKGSDCHSKEAYYYKKEFTNIFGENYDVIGEYWMPKWSNTLEPSARALKV